MGEFPKPRTDPFKYDGIGRLAKVVSAAGSFQYGYWSINSVSDRVQTLHLPSLSGGNFIANAYDPLARLVETVVQTPAGAVNGHEYAYNAANQRTRQTISGKDPYYRQHKWDYTYDNIGQLQTAKGTDRVYNPGTGLFDETPRLQEQMGYAYDAAWNLQRRTNNALTQSFTVDNKNQLSGSTRSGTATVAGTVGQGVTPVSVTVSGTGLSSGAAQIYSDNTWARAGATLANGNNSYTAQVLDNYSATANDTVTFNLPSSVTFQYDGNGNLTNDGRRVFEYDFENQLTNVFVASAWRSEFRYDAFGRKRVQRDYGWTGSAWNLTNEVRYVYDGMLVIQERNASNVPQVTYTRGNDLSGSLQGAGGIGGLLARTANSQLLSPNSSSAAHAFYHADGNGNITAMVNFEGSVLARYSYDPYGNTLSMSGSLAEANTYRFSSKEWQRNAGLYYYGYRFYEPNLQRWLNRDPLGEAGGINLYGFVGNSPLIWIDPYGLLWTDYIPDWVDDVGTACAGFADEVTWGATDFVREKLGWNETVDKDSLTYKGVNNATMAASMITPVGIAKGAGKTALKQTAKNLDKLSDAGKALDKGGELTKAGRAAQKHGSRPGSAFPPTKGNPTSINQQGQDLLDDILTSPGQTAKPNRFGGEDIYGSCGRGARFDANGNFMGFLEP